MRLYITPIVYIPCFVPQGSVYTRSAFVRPVHGASWEQGVSVQALLTTLSCRHDDTTSTVLRLENYTKEVSNTANRLKLKADKTELLCGGSHHAPALLRSSGPSLRLGTETVAATLGVTLRVLEVLSDILRAADGCEVSLLTLLILSATFDTVQHTILLRRLQTTYGLKQDTFCSRLYVVCNWWSSITSSLVKRQMRGDLIPVYHIIKLDTEHFFKLDDDGGGYDLRVHSLRVKVQRSRLQLRQGGFFSQRAVCAWNSLPSSVVEASSVHVFKKRLDNCCQDVDF